MLETLLAIARKEFLQLFRNKFIVRMVVTFQTVQLLMLGFIDVNARDLPMVVVDLDQSSFSRELVAKLRATNTFDIRFFTTSVNQAREHVRAGRAKVAVVIPPEFHRERARGFEASILAMVDGSDSVASSQALAAVEGVTGQVDVESDPGATNAESVTVHSMLLFNPERRTSYFTLPALLAMILANAYMGLSGMALVRERAMGTLERVLMSPVNYSGFILGKLAPYFVMGVLNACVLLLVMRWGFSVPVRGSFLLVGFSLVVYLLTSLGIGMNLAAKAETPSDVGIRAARIQIPMFFLSGYLFPLTAVPKWLLPLAYALPATHMIEIMRGAALRGAGFADLWIHLLYLCFAAVVLLAIAVKRFKATIHT